jgi:hypothetical protein
MEWGRIINGISFQMQRCITALQANGGQKDETLSRVAISAFWVHFCLDLGFKLFYLDSRLVINISSATK